jgi:mannosyl-oligosaccharide alpha-1,2-mannosidase
MGEKEAVNDILTHIKQIDWNDPKQSDEDPPNNPSPYVSLFETTIRYLGGMLSGYDLLNSETGTHRSLLAPGTVREVLE